MDFDFSSEQSALLDGLENLLDRYTEIPASNRKTHHFYNHVLDVALQEAGFLDSVEIEGIGRLEAAMVAERVARLPATVEVAASLLIGPALGFAVPRPIALIGGPLDLAYRNLPVAKTALIVQGDAIHVLPVTAADIELVPTIFAYPYGRFKIKPDLAQARVVAGEDAAKVLSAWRLAIAAEAAGVMRGAIDHTVGHVRDRRMFGKVLGMYQTVQHRLAECHQIQRAAYHLVLKAAFTGAPVDMLNAAIYAQSHVQKMMFDLHQFNGAMGMTNEHLLHFWTYRLRALQAELGGADAAALEAADLLWPQVA